jgi:anaerobic magnesium-protoporphyrin IX monomethyl ester cyclase
VLDAMDKGITREQIDAIVPRLQASGIRAGTFLQFGYLGESRDDIAKTIAMVTTLLPDDIGISISYPLPGTGFHEKVRRSLGEKVNWADSADLAMMFAGTFRPQFYRYLHGHVHRRHRGALALARLTGRRPLNGVRRLPFEILALIRALIVRPIDWAALKWLGRASRKTIDATDG